MSSVASVGSNAFAILQSSPDADEPASILSVLQSDSTVVSPPSVHESILKTFADDPQLQDAFAKKYAALMAKPENADISVENGQHDVLYETIMNNRDAFPAQAFTIKTELPGGGSIETAIPASAGGGTRKGSRGTNSAPLSETSQSAAFAKIIDAIILDDRKRVEDRLEATQNQLAERYE